MRAFVMLKITWTGLAIVLSLQGACSSEEGGSSNKQPSSKQASKAIAKATPQAKAEPKTLEVAQEKRHFIFTPANKRAAKLSFYINGSQPKLGLKEDLTQKFPVGTILSLDGDSTEKQSTTLRAEAPLLVPGSTPYLALTKELKISLANQLTVAMPRHAPLNVSLEGVPVLHTLLPNLLLTVTDGPMSFFAETAINDKQTLVYVPALNRAMHVVGAQPQEVQDIDWVAIADNTQVVSEKSCKGYSGANSTLLVSYSDTRVRIYERKTGEIRLEGRVGPSRKPKCPDVAVGAKGGKSSVYVKDEEIVVWLSKKLDALSK